MNNYDETARLKALRAKRLATLETTVTQELLDLWLAHCGVRHNGYCKANRREIRFCLCVKKLADVIRAEDVLHDALGPKWSVRASISMPILWLRSETTGTRYRIDAVLTDDGKNVRWSLEAQLPQEPAHKLPDLAVVRESLPKLVATLWATDIRLELAQYGASAEA